MKRTWQAFFWVLLAFPLPAPGNDVQPVKTEDPSARAAHAPRGSAQENASFEEHSLPSEKAHKNKAGQLKAAPRKTLKAPPGGEVRDSLSKGERPALRLLGKKQASKAPPPQNLPEVPRTAGPVEYTADYELERDAEVSVSIAGADGAPVRHFVVPAGGEGGRKGRNTLVWDGTDNAGNAAPDGEYFAYQSVRYGAGDKAGGKDPETRIIPLRKRDK